MNRATPPLTALAICAMTSAVFALYSVANEGTWPKSWPVELEPLRKQARTLVGPTIEQPHYEIPFSKREEFEAAWPHLLKVKSKGAPIFLVRAPDARLGMSIPAGVRIYAPPKSNHAMPEEPLAGPGWDNNTNQRGRWMYTTFIELIVDGQIVDLNRIAVPANTPIIDERFRKDEQRAPATQIGAQAGDEPRPAAPAATPAPASPVEGGKDPTQR
ncbi:MAG TPA: hypothetical protein VH518_11635 [Tepidisphaeraceae bacterium]|jgi:hypothetical protein